MARSYRFYVSPQWYAADVMDSMTRVLEAHPKSSMLCDWWAIFDAAAAWTRKRDRTVRRNTMKLVHDFGAIANLRTDVKFSRRPAKPAVVVTVNDARVGTIEMRLELESHRIWFTLKDMKQDQLFRFVRIAAVAQITNWNASTESTLAVAITAARDYRRHRLAEKKKR